MTGAGIPEHLKAFTAKMEAEGLQPIVVKTFTHYYRQVITGQTGLIPDRDIDPVMPDEMTCQEYLTSRIPTGKAAMPRSVRIILNGGLGTSMGLTAPKSLLPVKGDLTFLNILLTQASRFDVTLALMNSFSTHSDTMAALKKINPAKPPITFLQHKFPKILRKGYGPATWPDNPELEWNPPGHGDIYTALETSGMLDRLLDQGIEYAFISNSDNLGAVMDESLLGYFVEENFPFMMEVARRTPADMKGGHLARHKEDEYLLLRESAQCPEADRESFQDIVTYMFFNTNNLWVNLKYLKELIVSQKSVRLPMILNPKLLDPRDKNSPPVYQVETAMGAAISLFEGASVVCVPRTRFYPVKKCNDLLAVRSDYFLYSDEGGMRRNPNRISEDIQISLDETYYGKTDDMAARFPEGPPSLYRCKSLSVTGDVLFEGGVVVRGSARIVNKSASQAVIKAGTVVEGDIIF